MQGLSINDNKFIAITFRYPRNRLHQYHPIIGDVVYTKLERSIKTSMSILGEYGIFIGLRKGDVTKREDSTLEVIDQQLYSKFSSISIGLPSYRKLNLLELDQEVGNINAELFYKGNVGWQDIVNNLDIGRHQYNELRDKLHTIYEDVCKEQYTGLLLISGEAGSGKTTTLMRLAYDSLKDSEYKDLSILWLTPDSNFNYKQLQQHYYVSTKPILLFIDATGIDVIIESLQHNLKDKGDIPLIIIITARFNEWESAGGNSLDYGIFKSTVLTKLTDDEISSLIKKLDDHNQLYELKTLDEQERFRELKSKSGSQLLVAMVEATRGKRFHDIIYDEYLNLKKEHIEAAKAYEYVCLFYYYNVHIPEQLLISLTDSADEDEFAQLVLNHTHLIIVKHPYTKYGIKYRPRHQTIAKMLIDRLERYSGIINVLKRASVVVRRINDDDRQQRYVILEFVQNILKDFEYKPKSEFENNIYCLIDFINRNNRFLRDFHRMACIEKYIPELYSWSNIYRRLQMNDELIRIYESILDISPMDRNVNHRLAGLLSRSPIYRGDVNRISALYEKSLMAGNCSIRFALEYLTYSLRHGLDGHIDNLSQNSDRFIAMSYEEDEIRDRFINYIKAYKIEKDKSKLSTELTSLDEEIKLTRKLSTFEEIQFLKLVNIDNLDDKIDLYEKYLHTISPNRPKTILLKLAILSSRKDNRKKDALILFKEIYDKFIRSSPSEDDAEIVFMYAKTNSELNRKAKGENYRLFRQCINLKQHNIKYYLEFARYAENIGEIKTAISIAKQGLEIASKIGQYSSRSASILKSIAKA